MAVHLNYYLIAGTLACICDGNRDSRSILRGYCWPFQSWFSDAESRIAQPKAEGIQRRIFAENVAETGLGHLVVEDRQLSNISGYGDWQMSGWIDIAKQNIGDRVPSLLAQIPAFDDGRNFSRKWLDRISPSVQKNSDHRLSKFCNLAYKFVLTARQFESVGVAHQLV